MRKYKVEYLPLAMQDMVDIATYISEELHHPDAALSLAEKLIAAGDTLEQYPYRNGLYNPVKKMKYEYRKILVGNFGMYYRIDEDSHVVTIARVIYQRRDIDRLLD